MFYGMKVAVVKHIESIALLVMAKNTGVSSSAYVAHFVDSICEENWTKGVPTF